MPENEKIIERTVLISQFGGGYDLKFTSWTRGDMEVYIRSGKGKIADDIIITESLDRVEQAVHEYFSKES